MIDKFTPWYALGLPVTPVVYYLENGYIIWFSTLVIPHDAMKWWCPPLRFINAT